MEELPKPRPTQIQLIQVRSTIRVQVNNSKIIVHRSIGGCWSFYHSSEIRYGNQQFVVVLDATTCKSIFTTGRYIHHGTPVSVFIKQTTFSTDIYVTGHKDY